MRQVVYWKSTRGDTLCSYVEYWRWTGESDHSYVLGVKIGLGTVHKPIITMICVYFEGDRFGALNRHNGDVMTGLSIYIYILYAYKIAYFTIKSHKNPLNLLWPPQISCESHLYPASLLVGSMFEMHELYMNFKSFW